MSLNTPYNYVTGSEIGLSGEDQIRLALTTILQNGDVATMAKIQAAVENVMAEQSIHYRLSEQGKASLRFFVNKVAVQRGLIYKHDPRRRGWAITPKGRDYIEFSSTSQLSSKMLTAVGHDFQEALNDVYTLLRASKASVANDTASAAFVRAGVILTVTAWETFIEDILKAQVSYRLATAINPEDMLEVFDAVAKAWLSPKGAKRNVDPPDLRKWTGDNWKNTIRSYFEDELKRFNTPSSSNINIVDPVVKTTGRRK